jgi:hypothetical protein
MALSGRKPSGSINYRWFIATIGAEIGTLQIFLA